SNTVTVTWTVTGVDAWWQQRWAAGRTPASRSGGTESGRWLLSRTRTSRSTSCPVEDLAAVTGV
ncbi:hypothetical protein GS463_29295, partial [Rhodococcus hoagii]|nr:hypothetical protein [Prescottella equi]